MSEFDECCPRLTVADPGGGGGGGGGSKGSKDPPPRPDQL